MFPVSLNILLSLPLFFASSALMPYDVMPRWLRFAARPPQPNIATDGARVVCDACGGLGCWLVLPAVGIAIKIYNLCNEQNRRAFLFFSASLRVLCGKYRIDSGPYWFLQSPCHRSPSGRHGGSQPCGFVRVLNHR